MPPTTDIAASTWPALGTSATVAVRTPALLPEAVRITAAVLRDVDETYSRFRDDSELNHINGRAGIRTSVSGLMYRALETALRAARLTDGLVNPTVGRALRVAGYDRDFASLPDDGSPCEFHVEPIPGWQTIALRRFPRSVLMPSGMELDLGSTGKALAADLCAQAVATTHESAVLVSLGGDMAASGSPEGGWRVLITEDSRSPLLGDGQRIAIWTGGLATSSTTTRRWRRGGVELHHIIDPATGQPAKSPWRTVSVAAATCVDANIAATAAILKGDGALEWLSAQRLPARLVHRDGAISTTASWPAA